MTQEEAPSKPHLSQPYCREEPGEGDQPGNVSVCLSVCLSQPYCRGDPGDGDQPGTININLFRAVVLHNPGVCLPLKPGSFQQTRVPHSLPMGVN